MIDSIARYRDETEDICSESDVKKGWVCSCINMSMCSSVYMGVRGVYLSHDDVIHQRKLHS